MKRFILLAAAVFVLSGSAAFAQLDPNCLGIGAEFSGRATMAKFVYTATTNISLQFGIGYTSTSQTIDPEPAVKPESESSLGFLIGGKYFLADKDVDPFIGLAFRYSKPHEHHTITGISLLVGGQASLVKKVSIFGQVGLDYDMDAVETTVGTQTTKTTTNTLGLFTGAVGAIFYL